MCARLVQILNSSYVPLYLTDTLGFEKVSPKCFVEHLQPSHFTLYMSNESDLSLAGIYRLFPSSNFDQRRFFQLMRKET